MLTLEEYLNSKDVPEAVIRNLIGEGYDLKSFGGLTIELLRLMNFKVAEIQVLLPLITESTNYVSSGRRDQFETSSLSDPFSDSESVSDSGDVVDETRLLPYFTQTDLDERSPYDKKCLLTQLDRYEMALSSGLCTDVESIKPPFVAMKEVKEKRNTAKLKREVKKSLTPSVPLRSSARNKCLLDTQNACALSEEITESSMAAPSHELSENQQIVSEISCASQPACSSATSSSRGQPACSISTSSSKGQAAFSSSANSSKGQAAFSSSASGSKSQPSCPSSASGSKSQPFCPSSASGSKSQPSCPSSASGSKSQPSCPSSASGSKSQPSCPSSASGSRVDIGAGSSAATSCSSSRPMGSANERAVSITRPTGSGLLRRSGSASLDRSPPKNSQAESSLPENFECMKAELPKFDVIQILNDRIGDSDKSKLTLTRLKTNGFLPEKRDRKLVIRVLTRYLYSLCPSRPNSVTTTEKEGMAKSFVRCFPKYCGQYDENTMPWDHIYCKSSNTGWIANASRVLQNQNRQRASKRKKTDSDGAGPSRESSELDSDEVDNMGLLVPGRVEKHEIFMGMAKSFNRRNTLRDQEVDIASMLKSFPHLISYEGEVLRQEFRLMQPQYQDMCKAFLSLQDKVLSLPLKYPIALPFQDDTIRALITLSQNLPHDIPNRRDGETRNTFAKLEDIIEYIGANEDIDDFILEKRERLSRHVQPYLLAVRSSVTKKIQKHFLVLDEKVMQLTQCQIGTGSTIRALDYLMMSYFVFNVNYPFGWRNTLHFLATSFYKVFEKTAPGKRKDLVTPSERELLLILTNM